jgi:ribosomal protein S12 methylthiotransferase
MKKKGTYYVTTLGCPKNQADSREMERNLTARGLIPVTDPSEADYHIINSCAFISDAKTETIDTLLDADQYRKEHIPDQKIVLAGCFSQKYESVITHELPEADIHFGTGRYHQISEILSSHNPEFFVTDPVNFSGVTLISSTAPHAPLKISDGCSRGCTFCAIPGIRGPFRSLDEAAIIKEAHLLSSENVREILIVSQDTSSYGGRDEMLLADLIEKISDVEGISWIRLMYLYPDLKSGKLLEELHRRSITKIVPYLESPVQHASPKMLKAMGRSGDYEWLKGYFSRARSLWPELEIRTSFLIGYPGESEEDIEYLHRFLDDVRPEKLAFFAYSPEEETPAYTEIINKRIEMPDESLVSHRISEIRSHYLSILSEHQKNRVDKIYQCMIDEITPDTIYARRPQDAPEADEQIQIETGSETRSNLKIGDIVPVKITGFYEFDMTGIIL